MEKLPVTPPSIAHEGVSKGERALAFDPSLPTLTVVKAVVRRSHDPRVLILRRAASRRQGAGNWELPGGTLDPGEDPEAGMLREFCEETGLAFVGNPPLRRLHHESVIQDTRKTARGLEPVNVHHIFYSGKVAARAQLTLDPHEHDAAAWVLPGRAARRIGFWVYREAVVKRKATAPASFPKAA